MERNLAATIFKKGLLRYVVNLANRLAITCDLRLALKDFISQSHCPRINQRLLKKKKPAKDLADYN